MVGRVASGWATFLGAGIRADEFESSVRGVEVQGVSPTVLLDLLDSKSWSPVFFPADRRDTNPQISPSCMACSSLARQSATRSISWSDSGDPSVSEERSICVGFINASTSGRMEETAFLCGQDNYIGGGGWEGDPLADGVTGSGREWTVRPLPLAATLSQACNSTCPAL